jgi:hypothetical protein
MAESSTTSQRRPKSAPIVTREDDFHAGLATAAIVGLGAFIFRRSLLPGMLLGVASMAAPRIFPELEPALRPLIKNTLKAGLAVARKGKEMTAEASEQLEDIIAEIRYEEETAKVENKNGQ